MGKRKNKKPKDLIKISEAELLTQLREQIDFLEHDAEQYDKGKTHFAKTMASRARVLLHHTGMSKSLLKQLKITDNIKFTNSCLKQEPSKPVKLPPGYKLGPEKWPLTGLCKITIKNNKVFFTPHLDSETTNLRKFNNWWKKVIVDDRQGLTFTREEIVLFLANKIGGNHVDPKVEKKQYELATGRSVGIFVEVDEEGRTSFGINLDGNKDAHVEFIEDVHLASMRQITYELLDTLTPFKKDFGA